MSTVNATRRGRPSGWRSSTRHSVTGPDQLGYASKSVRTAKQSSTDPITSAEYDCAKSATARGRYRALAGDVKIRVALPWRERFRYARAQLMPVRTVEWRNGRVVMLDQRLLPMREVYRVYTSHRDVARAIKDMVVRGAPAIGVAAAMGIALGARTLRGDFVRGF